jgi:ABC-type phosphate transport system permease subunit
VWKRNKLFTKNKRKKKTTKKIAILSYVSIYIFLFFIFIFLIKYSLKKKDVPQKEFLEDLGSA